MYKTRPKQVVKANRNIAGNFLLERVGNPTCHILKIAAR